MTVAAVSQLFNFCFSAFFLSVFENTVYSTARSAERQRGAAPAMSSAVGGVPSALYSNTDNTENTAEYSRIQNTVEYRFSEKIKLFRKLPETILPAPSCEGELKSRR